METRLQMEKELLMCGWDKEGLATMSDETIKGLYKRESEWHGIG